MQDSERARALEQALRALAYDIGTVRDVAARRGDPDVDHRLMLVRLDHWRSVILNAIAPLEAVDPPPSGASPQADATCEHGTAMDVHCCNCHSGFIFDVNHECPSPELTWREAVEQALGVENDPENHTPSWAFDVVRAAREIGNAPTPASPQAETSEQDVPVLRITVTRDVATEYYAAEFRSADDKVGGMGDYSATPVGALANLCATLIQIDEDNSVERRQPTPVSPVEPEPPTGVR